MVQRRFSITVMACALAVAALSWGCAASANRQRKEHVWSEVRPDSATRSDAHVGKLVVYTAPDVHAHWEDGIYTHYYSDYEVRSGDDVVLKKVHNSIGGVVVRPAEVELEPGDYRVRARAVGQGWVLVPVIIKAGRQTTVHLDGTPLDAGKRRGDSGPAGN